MGNEDLLNLCRLNLMEEHVDDNAFITENERETVLKTIDWKRRGLARNIISDIDNPPKSNGGDSKTSTQQLKDSISLLENLREDFHDSMRWNNYKLLESKVNAVIAKLESIWRTLGKIIFYLIYRRSYCGCQKNG